jgi:hypothetical protein
VTLWAADAGLLDTGRVQRLQLRQGTTRLTWADVVDALATDAGFCDFFNRLLANAPYTAYFWETPPVTRHSAGQAFECVLVDSPALAAVAANADAFARQFAEAAGDIAVFPNLGHDACLIAPCPRAVPDVYAHLAAFTRGAPHGQQQAFWKRLGETVRERLTGRPLWLSTSGLGVYWLHARLDSRPKYYTWHPYI